MLNRVQAAQCMRTRVQYKADKIAAMKAGLIVVMLVSIVTLSWLCWLQYDLRAQAVRELELQKKSTTKAFTMLATVMNGGTLFDHASATGYFFDRPTAVKLGVK